MSSAVQLSLFGKSPDSVLKNTLKQKRSGTFLDNMKLPVHRWFRYSAGFSAEWVQTIIQSERPCSILDPFSGSGTVNITADKMGIPSFGYEAHPFVYRLALAKTCWTYSPELFLEKGHELLNLGMRLTPDLSRSKNTLLAKCYSIEALEQLFRLRDAWISLYATANSQLAKLTFLAVTAVLRQTSSAGTAQWQYILPEKKKAKTIEPNTAFKNQIVIMAEDMLTMQAEQCNSKAHIVNGDARTHEGLQDNSIDLVITSPPYANNYDYADATRLEMTFWGEINSWGDLHDSVRQHLICSSAQHASKEKFILGEVLSSKHLFCIQKEISTVCEELATIRETKGGKKHYHTMIAAYFKDMSQIIQSLRSVVKKQGKMYFVIGDSAPYGVYVPVDKWLGDIAIAAGFSRWRFEKLRDRNVKWKNRKHRVPLHEGILVIEG